MGFFDKVKGALNIGGSKLTIQGPGTVQNGGNLQFTAQLVAGKMEQTITSVEAKLVMAESQKQYNLQGNSSQNIQYVTIAQDSVTEAFTVQPGEQREFQFSLPVNVASDGADQGGMMGALNKLNNMATNRQRAFKLKVVADIQGATDAGAEMDIVVQ